MSDRQQTLDLPPDSTLVAVAEQQIQERQKRIEYFITEYTVEILAQKTHAGEYFVAEYQREFTWEPLRRCRFIESLLMGLPIPFLFFWEDPSTGKLEIVDGSQRLRTLEEFIYGDLKLDELEKLPALNGFRFRDLPEARKRKTLNRSIRGIMLSEHTDEEARLDLFERINTSSKIANPTEVRRGALKGPFMSLIIRLASDPLLLRLAPVAASRVKEREREELVARLFVWGDRLSGDLPGYRDDTSNYIYKYVKEMNESFEKNPQLADDYAKRFDQVLRFVERVFPNGFRKTADATSTPRVRFEAIAVGSFLALQSGAKDLRVGPEDLRAWMESDKFSELTRSDAANVKSKLIGRIEYVRDKLLGAT